MSSWFVFSNGGKSSKRHFTKQNIPKQRKHHRKVSLALFQRRAISKSATILKSAIQLKNREGRVSSKLSNWKQAISGLITRLYIEIIESMELKDIDPVFVVSFDCGAGVMAAATDGELDGQSPAADLWWCTLRALCCSAMFTSMDLAAAARDASPYNTADCYPRPQLLWPSHCRFANTNIPLLTILSSPP